jgi:DNA-binding GntR family transcriptional regulator
MPTPSYKGKRDVLVEQLSEAILRAELKPGEWLRQDEIAARFGVSPTPVREALRVLETQGLVIYEAHRGVRVANFAGSAKQFYRLREALECLAAELAVENMTDEAMARINSAVDDMQRASKANDREGVFEAHRRFHLSLYEAGGFSALVDIIVMVWSRFPWDVLLALPQRRRVSVEAHRAIAESAASGDAKATAARLAEHLRLVGRQLEEISRNEPERSND